MARQGRKNRNGAFWAKALESAHLGVWDWNLRTGDSFYSATWARMLGYGEDELANTSPGDFLFFDNIQNACQTGFAVYDFSVGDEPYKRLWCDIETQHFEVLVPLTLKGRALGQALRQGARLKAFVKNSPTIWKLAKMLRRKAAGQTPPLPTEDEH
ncbi:MAG: GNAT family N-acetyltransferase [Mesorhizobium sp.]|nr:MAG: GNAT family N-acetyltransferase [Mesorhizobium sp.]